MDNESSLLLGPLTIDFKTSFKEVLMNVKVLEEAGHAEALLGISLSFNSDIDRMWDRAERLAPLDGGHNKFLEAICVWLDIDAPRYWWSQFDTYRIGVTKQSESTMHTLTKRELEQGDFETPINPIVLGVVNGYIRDRNLVEAKAHLPEAFLQRRIVCTNYKSLRGVVKQRANHKLPEWQVLIQELEKQLDYPEYFK
jgi:hypothetical protein